MKIPRESWAKIQMTIRQYPKSVKLITEWEMEILDANLKEKDPTAHKAMLLDSEYAKRLRREIEAVENAMDHLSPHEQRVVRVRFWSGRSVVPYEYMRECNYSRRQMQTIISYMVRLVGIEIGELNPNMWSTKKSVRTLRI